MDTKSRLLVMEGVNTANRNSSLNKSFGKEYAGKSVIQEITRRKRLNIIAKCTVLASHAKRANCLSCRLGVENG
jgi:hypothetical protein